jgi:tetratricopeptide (TPR) repeat protein
LSIKGQLIYFIISATFAKIVIPLIHNHVCIEHIYIQWDDSIPQNCSWIEVYSKIRGTWSSLREIEEQVKQDRSSIETRPSHWSRTPDIFGELWTQKLSTTIVPAISDDIRQTYALPIIVTLCDIRPTPFHLSKGGIKTYEFSTVEECHQFIKKQETLPIFLIIIGDHNGIFDKVPLLVQYDSLHALYIFPINNNNDKHYDTISVCESPKISGVFYHEKDLLLQMVADICFFRQMPRHIPKMSVLKMEFDILSTMNENKKAFFSFEFFIDILKQLWCAPGVPSEIFDCIERAGTGLSSDLYMNNMQLTLEIDRLIEQFDSDTFLKACSQLRLINQHLESSVQKIYPFSMTIYRAQLMSGEDLNAIQNKENSLFAIHTFVLASRSFSSTKTICRQACNNGLTAVFFEINIPKKTPLTYLDSDIIIFPLSTVFKIISITKAPDKICHVQVELADSTMDLITEQLYYTSGEHLTWLTFGNYLAHIKKFDAAENYFKYLQTILSDSPECASIYNNMSLMYLSMNGKDQEALDYLHKAQNLIESNIAKVSEKRTE